jgi:hypothetical protein
MGVGGALVAELDENVGEVLVFLAGQAEDGPHLAERRGCLVRRQVRRDAKFRDNLGEPDDVLRPDAERACRLADGREFGRGDRNLGGEAAEV